MSREEIKEFVKTHYGDLSAQEISESVGISTNMVYRYAHDMGLRKPKKWIAERASMQHPGAKGRKNYIQEHFADTPTKELALTTGLSESYVYQIARSLGIRKSETYVSENLKRLGSELAKSEIAKKNRFKKGHIPANKGKKMDDELRKKVSRTFFRKGNVPHNTCPVGTVVITTDGYAKVKIAEPNRWRFRSAMVWEEAHGAVPEGHILHHIDGDRLNDDISNLRPLSRTEHLLSNRYKDYPIELIEVWALSSELKKKIYKRL